MCARARKLGRHVCVRGAGTRARRARARVLWRVCVPRTTVREPPPALADVCARECVCARAHSTRARARKRADLLRTMVWKPPLLMYGPKKLQKGRALAEDDGVEAAAVSVRTREAIAMVCPFCESAHARLRSASARTC